MSELSGPVSHQGRMSQEGPCAHSHNDKSQCPASKGLWRKREPMNQEEDKAVWFVSTCGLFDFPLRAVPREWSHLLSHGPRKGHPTQTLAVCFFISSVSRVCPDLVGFLRLAVNHVSSQKSCRESANMLLLAYADEDGAFGRFPWPSLPSLVPNLRPKGPGHTLFFLKISFYWFQRGSRIEKQKHQWWVVSESVPHL